VSFLLVIEANFDLAHLVPVHDGANECRVDKEQSRTERRLKENKHLEISPIPM